MNQRILTMFGVALCAAAAYADTAAFREVAVTAGRIEDDAVAISQGLRAKQRDIPKIKASIDALGTDIAALRQKVDEVDASLATLTDQQKKNWDLVKTKVQLLMIFQERKESLSSLDLEKNRKMVRHLAEGIAQRAKMLQQTARAL